MHSADSGPAQPDAGVHGPRLRRLAWLAHLMDDRFRLPGTQHRFGLDGLVGLIPGLGDSAGALVSFYIVGEAWQAGARWTTLARMLWNLLVDFLIGLLPLAGDLLDFGWRANLRNLKLLEEDLLGRRPES